MIAAATRLSIRRAFDRLADRRELVRAIQQRGQAGPARWHWIVLAERSRAAHPNAIGASARAERGQARRTWAICARPFRAVIGPTAFEVAFDGPAGADCCPRLALVVVATSKRSECLVESKSWRTNISSKNAAGRSKSGTRARAMIKRGLRTSAKAPPSSSPTNGRRGRRAPPAPRVRAGRHYQARATTRSR
jgi:hypothetical protein